MSFNVGGIAIDPTDQSKYSVVDLIADDSLVIASTVRTWQIECFIRESDRIALEAKVGNSVSVTDTTWTNGSYTCKIILGEGYAQKWAVPGQKEKVSFTVREVIEKSFSIGGVTVKPTSSSSYSRENLISDNSVSDGSYVQIWSIEAYVTPGQRAALAAISGATTVADSLFGGSAAVVICNLGSASVIPGNPAIEKVSFTVREVIEKSFSVGGVTVKPTSSSSYSRENLISDNSVSDDSYVQIWSIEAYVTSAQRASLADISGATTVSDTLFGGTADVVIMQFGSASLIPGSPAIEKVSFTVREIFAYQITVGGLTINATTNTARYKKNFITLGSRTARGIAVIQGVSARSALWVWNVETYLTAAQLASFEVIVGTQQLSYANSTNGAIAFTDGSITAQVFIDLGDGYAQRANNLYKVNFIASQI